MKNTIEDVAKRAGVSITTVSRVINNNYPVKKETRLVVEQAIKELEYQPNPMARGLIMKKSKTIGIVVPSITNMFFTEVIHGIEKEFKRLGYDILLSNFHGDDVLEAECVTKLIGRLVDGVIVVTPGTANLVNGFYDGIARKLPVICINGYSKDAKVNFILSDEQKGAAEALDYLIALGHRKIVFARGGDSYSYDVKQEIYEAYMEQLGEKKLVLDIPDGNSIDVVKNAEIKLKEVVQAGLRPGKDVTAFFACNDLMAAGLLNACGDLGIQVPEMVSILGFDNIILSEMLRIKLTTVDQNMRRIGIAAAERMIVLIDELVDKDLDQSNAAKILMIDTKLVIRDSCRKPQA